MTPAIISVVSSLISAVVAIVVCIINNKFQNDKTLALLDFRLKTLEEKVDKHNNLVERTYRLEEKSAVQDEKIDTLEKAVGK